MQKQKQCEPGLVLVCFFPQSSKTEVWLCKCAILFNPWILLKSPSKLKINQLTHQMSHTFLLNQVTTFQNPLELHTAKYSP